MTTARVAVSGVIHDKTSGIGLTQQKYIVVAVYFDKKDLIVIGSPDITCFLNVGALCIEFNDKTVCFTTVVITLISGGGSS